MVFALFSHGERFIYSSRNQDDRRHSDVLLIFIVTLHYQRINARENVTLNISTHCVPSLLSLLFFFFIKLNQFYEITRMYVIRCTTLVSGN